MAANRIGKSDTGAYEIACHTTGRYPSWWNGRRFDKPVKVWVCGETNKKVREVNQSKLFGQWHDIGTGFIPHEALGKSTNKSGVPEAIDTYYIHHSNGGQSQIVMKSYEEGWQAFDSDEIDIVWLDEEPDQRIFTACVMRTMTTKGLIFVTATPLLGLTDLMNGFFDPDEREKTGRFFINATWEDAPHLDSSEKQRLLANIEEYQRDARSKGLPYLGAGRIYRTPWDQVSVDPFPIPEYFVQGYGLDVGWNRTAACWGAHDRSTDVAYLTSEHYMGETAPIIHADAIKARGDWIVGAIDPSANGERNSKDGEQLTEEYRKYGLKLILADNTVEAGIHDMWTRLQTGRLKVFNTLSHFKAEYEMYRRDERGKVYKKHDHLMDASRYLIRNIKGWRVKPVSVPLQPVMPSVRGWQAV
jgi:phage terminase large subunit-like protein